MRLCRDCELTAKHYGDNSGGGGMLGSLNGRRFDAHMVWWRMRHRTPDIWTGEVLAEVVLKVKCPILEEHKCESKEVAHEFAKRLAYAAVQQRCADLFIDIEEIETSNA